MYIVGGLLLQLLLKLFRGEQNIDMNTQTIAFHLQLLLALVFTLFFEGFPLSQKNALVWGIFVRNIPIGMVLIF